MNDKISVEGKVTDVARDLFFVSIGQAGDILKCTLGGRLRKNKIRVMAGDTVTVELCPYDTTKGRVTYRHL